MLDSYRDNVPNYAMRSMVSCYCVLFSSSSLLWYSSSNVCSVVPNVPSLTALAVIRWSPTSVDAHSALVAVARKYIRTFQTNNRVIVGEDMYASETLCFVCRNVQVQLQRTMFPPWWHGYQRSVIMHVHRYIWLHHSNSHRLNRPPECPENSMRAD